MLLVNTHKRAGGGGCQRQRSGEGGGKQGYSHLLGPDALWLRAVLTTPVGFPAEKVGLANLYLRAHYAFIDSPRKDKNSGRDTTAPQPRTLSHD
ncbi:hypothetical protein E2C01_000295 [Portunus trituberculatus]|uniref:Uncharacterized protein n=1 Tax=Portunus trituberculatus TaxID=210409 RepID=A0A5B7CDX6_PORTR|nr:hypothetical protein [Portunus trituberculatus]